MGPTALVIMTGKAEFANQGPEGLAGKKLTLKSVVSHRWSDSCQKIGAQGIA